MDGWNGTAMQRKGYSSNRMAQREADILATARDLLAEGDGTIPMRKLAQQSGVALSTLYARFGSQDAIASTAIAQVFRERLISWDETKGFCIIDRLDQRLQSAVSEVLASPMFARKMMQLFFSSTVNNVRVADILYNLAYEENLRAVEDFSDQKMLKPDCSVKMLADELVIIQYAAIGHWASARINDSRLLASSRNLVFARLASALVEPYDSVALKKTSVIDREDGINGLGRTVPVS